MTNEEQIEIDRREQQDQKFVKWTSLIINVIFSLLLIGGIILTILAIVNMNTYDGKKYTSALLSVGVILAFYPTLRMLFKNLRNHLKWDWSKRWFNNGYKVVIKTHLLGSLAAIAILLGHASYWIYQASRGYYVKMKHGVLKIKPIGFDFGEIIGIVALSMMILLIFSGLIIKYNKDKSWMPKYRIFHIVFAITSAILIIVHIATV